MLCLRDSRLRSFYAHHDAKSRILLRPRGARVLDEAFERETARLLEEWRTAHKKGPEEAMHDDERSFEERLKDAWDAECADFAKYMNGTKKGYYGNPIASPGRVSRYAFWPLWAKRWLHFWCACILLIIPWGNPHIERVNSGAGLINTKLRGRMTPDTLQRMVLLRVWLRVAIAKIDAAGMELNMETMRAAIFAAAEEDAVEPEE